MNRRKRIPEVVWVGLWFVATFALLATVTAPHLSR